MKKLINSIKYKDLEFFSFILMIFWSISPIIEYILKYYIKMFSKYYFTFIIYFIGFLGIILYIIYFLKKSNDEGFRIKNYIPHMLIIVLLIISIISSIFSSDPYLSFFGNAYRKEGLIVYIMYIGFVLSASIIEDKKYKKNIFRVIIASALFITIASFFLNNFKYYHFANIYHAFNHYGYFLMISAMLSGFMFANVDGKKRFIYLIIYVFLLYMLIHNDTFGCYLAMFISLLFSFIYSLIKKYKRFDITIILVTFIVCSFLISFFNIRIGGNDKQSSKGIVFNNIVSFASDVDKVVKNDEKTNLNSVGTGRGKLWKEAWNYTLDHPLIGGGMEALQDYYKENKVGYNDRPHNIILQVSSFIGIPGAIIYISLIFYLAISNLKKLKNNIFNIMIYVTAMCYFISSIFGNSMYYTSPYFMILLGFLINMNRKKIFK